MQENFPARAAQNPDDPRRYPRFSLPLPVSLLVRDAGASLASSETVCLQDISLTGLSFTAERAYRGDQTLEVQIALGEHLYALRLLVQRSHPTETDGRAAHSIATLFQRGDDIHPFLAHLAAFLHRQP